MTTELERDDSSKVLPLYRAAGACYPLLLSVIEKRQRGQIFVDPRENPGAALVVNNFGFMGLFEDKPDSGFDARLADLFRAPNALRPSYLLWYDPPARWQQRLDALSLESLRKRRRIRFKFDEARADYLHQPAQCPDGFELKTLDKDLLPRTEKFGLEIGARFWSSDDDFVENGLGICLLKNGEVVSVCYAASVADGLAEVDVATQTEFRTAGLASVVSQQFIKECAGRGLVPTWDCFTYNAGSLRLAERLGFVAVNEYPFYSFNVPVKSSSQPGS